MRLFTFLFTLILLAFVSLKTPDLTEKWNDLKDFPKQWTLLERDSISYLIYSPCDGDVPKIIFNSDNSLTVHWRLEAVKMFITGFKKINDDKFQLLAESRENDVKTGSIVAYTQFDIRVVDRKRKLILWKWETKGLHADDKPDITKWVMTPFRFEKEYRRVYNPCPTEMKPEKHFLPVEFN